jgi:uncharacterized protein (DUF433 family)
MNNVLITEELSNDSLGFYTPAEASRIAQVPQWTVNSWRRAGIVIPSIAWIDEQEKSHLGHTFETVVFLRLLRMLRGKRITLIESVKAVKQLRERFGHPSNKWSDIKIFVYGKDVVVYDELDGWDSTVATKGNQKVAEFSFGVEFTKLKERADALLIPEPFLEFVEIDLSIQNGLPIVFDTSVPTSLIHSFSRQGYKADEINEMYPFMSKKFIIGAEKYETYLDKIIHN